MRVVHPDYWQTVCPQGMEGVIDRDFRKPLSIGQYVVQLFKWIKQHLRIKAFYGASENAVNTQIRIAVAVYVLVAITRRRLGLEASLYQILQILTVTTTN